MSLLGSLTTAISGLSAQSRALGHISDNVANSQTVGFKRTDTNFISYLTRSNQRLHLPGAVEARPDHQISIQGTIEQSENPLAMAVAGQGFFSIAQANGTLNGVPTFDDRQFFTRAGDFSLDKDGFMVNGQGYYLQGWTVNGQGNPDRTQIQPIRVSQLVFNPVATENVDLAANLPAGSAAISNTQVQVYDSLGRLEPIDVTFTPDPLVPHRWTLSLDAPGAATPALGTIVLNFGGTAVPVVQDGTIGAFGAATGTLVGSTGVAGDPATVQFTADFGQGPQTVSLNLGAFSEARGLTQFADDVFGVRNLAQDGVPLGAYSGLSLRENGDLAVNYDNGQTRVIYRVPVVAFNEPDRLQRLDGQAFMRTVESGEARITDPSSNGVGKLVAGSLERSNVDIAAEFSKLIVAQRAYTANTRIVTTADELLAETINMRR